MALVEETYIRLTTFRRSGEGVATTVWLADIGNGEGGFYTSSSSGKIKRLRHTPRVTVQPCNFKGDPAPGSTPVETTARIIGGDEYAAMRQQIIAKYGFMTKLARYGATLIGVLTRKRFPYGDVGVAVKLPDGS